MPLSDDNWSKGKCGFKALQYMALGIPTIASSIGVNSEIIDDGINGYLASTDEEWENKITNLISSNKLRKKLGLAAHKTVENRFSVIANQTNYLNYFEQLLH